MGQNTRNKSIYMFYLQHIISIFFQHKSSSFTRDKYSLALSGLHLNLITKCTSSRVLVLMSNNEALENQSEIHLSEAFAVIGSLESAPIQIDWPSRRRFTLAIDIWHIVPITCHFQHLAQVLPQNLKSIVKFKVNSISHLFTLEYLKLNFTLKQVVSQKKSLSGQGKS